MAIFARIREQGLVLRRRRAVRRAAGAVMERLEDRRLLAGSVLASGLPTISIGAINVAEAESGTTLATFTLNLSASSGSPVSVAYATADGTAMGGTGSRKPYEYYDYLSDSGVVTFPPGQVSRTLGVYVIGDTIAEVNETFLVQLSNPANATLAVTQATATIQDNDGADAIPPTAALYGAIDLTVKGSAPCLFKVRYADTMAVRYLSLDASDLVLVGQNNKLSLPTTFLGAAYEPDGSPIAVDSGVLIATYSVAAPGGLWTGLYDDYYTVAMQANQVADGRNNTVPAGSIGTLNVAIEQLPGLRITEALSVVEGDTGNQSVTLTVTLDAHEQPVSVNYATATPTSGEANPASAGSDYVFTSGTLTFAAGENSKTFTVQVLGDVLDEADDRFYVELSGATNATIGQSRAVITIQDDDPLPTISIEDAAQVEGNANTANLLFTVRLSVLSGRAVSVNYASSNGTAAAGGDYSAVQGTLTIPAGQLTATIAVPIHGDLTLETSETFFLSLSDPLNATLLRDQATGIIQTDDLPTISILDTSPSVSEGGTTAVNLVVSLSATPLEPVTIAWETAEATGAKAARAGSDYTSASGTLTFAAGTTELTQKIRVDTLVVDDLLDEPDETFWVKLSSAAGAIIGNGQRWVTIKDNDPSPMIQIGSLSVSEGDEGSKTLQVPVVLSWLSASEVKVDWTTLNGTAQAGSDFVAASGTLTFPAETQIATIDLTILGDQLDEGDESFTLQLSNPQGATLGPSAVGTVTIANDEPLPTLSLGDVSIAEGHSKTKNALFTLGLSAPRAQDTSITFLTEDGSARAGSDYQARTGSVTIKAGATSAVVAVPILGDRAPEPNESFLLRLSGVSGNAATIADGEGLCTILNDDAAQSEIKVTFGAKEIRDNQAIAVSFGTIALRGKGPIRTFKVQNLGSAPLKLSKLKLPKGFAVADPLVGTLAPGKSDFLSLRLISSKAGAFSGSISFSTNDLDENPFNFAIAGQVSAKRGQTKPGGRARRL